MDKEWKLPENEKPEEYSFVLATIETPTDRWVDIVAFGTDKFVFPGINTNVQRVIAWMEKPDAYCPPTPTDELNNETAG